RHRSTCEDGGMSEPAGTGSTAVGALPAPRTSFVGHARHVIGENPVTGIAFALFLLIVACAVLGPFIAPYDPLASDTSATLKSPSAAHWFGTDQLGRDILSRVMVATRLDLAIAIFSVVLVFMLGGLSGIAAGFLQAARLSGNGEYRILPTQILPNIMPIMTVQMSLTMGYAILNAAGLSFIGLGVRPPTPEWGIMVAE